jgi:hypothetical protein
MANELLAIQVINTNLKRILNTKPFQLGEFGYIAELVPALVGQEETIRPAIVDNEGNCTYLGVDDKFPFQCYYLLTGFESEHDDPFGDNPLVKSQTAAFSLIVYGYRPTLQMTKEQLIAAVDAAMPDNFTITEKTAVGALNVTIADVKHNIDKQNIFNSQVGIDSLYLQPEYILFSVDFTIETQINTSCFTIC